MNNNNELNTDSTFGKKLKVFRKFKGYTQQSLAEKTEIDEKHLCRIENGKYFPTFSMLNKLLNVLEVSIGDVGLD